jgi:hypothetical protein
MSLPDISYNNADYHRQYLNQSFKDDFHGMGNAPRHRMQSG